MLDVGSTLFERLDAALLCMRKLRCKDFKRQPRDPATNPPIIVVHKEIYVVGRELVVPRVDCGRQWHGFRLLGSTAVLQTIARLLRSWKTSLATVKPQHSFLRPTPLSRGTIMGDSGERNWRGSAARSCAASLCERNRAHGTLTAPEKRRSNRVSSPPAGCGDGPRIALH